MSKKLYQKSVVREVLDQETGELITLETSKEYSQQITSDKFYMTFIDFVAPWYQLKGDSTKHILVKFCELAEYNTGKINISTTLRETICDALQIAQSSFTRSIKQLKDLKLISGDRGEYLLNPAIHWKGDLKTRKELMKNSAIKITFNLE